MRIALHFGAHKTASTYIQDALKATSSRLVERGVAYIPLEQTRRTLTLRVRKGGLRLRPTFRRLLEAHAGCHNLILSDENLIGGPGELVRTGLLYPALRERAGRLTSVFKDHDVHVFIATRSYDTFLSSMYCEYIRHNPFIARDEYLDSFVADEISWIDPIAALCGLVGEERVTAWRYEDFREIENDVFAALCGIGSIDVEKPPAAVWESLSGRAVDALSAARAVLGAAKVQSLVQPMTSAFPKGPGNPPFEMFDPDRALDLRERYRRDWDALEQRFPRMTILRPSEASASGPPNYRPADLARVVRS